MFLSLARITKSKSQLLRDLLDYGGDKKLAREDDIRKNASGYSDPTAYQAIKNVENEDERFHKLLDTIFNICELSGFHLEERIVLKDKNTGKVYR